MSASHKTQNIILKYLLYVIVAAVIYEFMPLINKTNVLLPETLTIDNNRVDSTKFMTGYTITKIVDGDTIDVDKNNTTTKVRLLGINTPESVDPRRAVECYGIESSKYISDLASGAYVYMETDDSQSKYDKYGRLLAYVYMQDGQMINRKMIAEGYAYEYTYDKAYKYQKDFKALQSYAKLENRGLWAANTCNGSKQIIK